MKAGYEQQMRKGLLELVILQLVSQADTHGYELITAIAERSGGTVQLREGTLYPILYRLEDEGLVQSAWAQLEEGRAKPKKQYSITPKGREALESMRAQWKSFSLFVNNVLEEGEL